MKICALAVCAFAGAAFGQALPVPSTLIQATHAEPAALDSLGISGAPVYSSIPGPYAAFASGTFATRDDYQTTIPGGFATRFTMDQFKFVGGVSAAGGILDFFFLQHGTNNVMASFGVQLGQAGDFIWTITLNGVNGIGNVPAAGDVQIQTRGTTTGRWFMTTSAPVPGANDNTFGHGSSLTPNKGYGAFELQKKPVPAPGALALLGVGGLVAIRRRR